MQLSLVRPDSPVPTVEIDTEGRSDALLLLAKVLRRPVSAFARSNPKVVATLYVYSTSSINFGQPTSSIFIAVAGPVPLLQRAHSALTATFQVRYSDYLSCTVAAPIFHIEGGAAYELDAADNWSFIA